MYRISVERRKWEAGERALVFLCVRGHSIAAVFERSPQNREDPLRTDVGHAKVFEVTEGFDAMVGDRREPHQNE